MSTGTELAPIFGAQDLDLLATRVASSRLIPGITTPQAAFTLMLLCQAEGLHPAVALKRYHIIEGKPTMRADAMQAEFQRRGGIVRWVKSTDTECVARFIHPIHAPDPGFEMRFTIEDAKRAKIAHKPVWQSYPSNMLRARVISNGVRAVLPEAVVGVYTPEEVQDMRAGEVAPGVVLETTGRAEPTTNGHALPAPNGSDWRNYVSQVVQAANDELDAECKMHDVQHRGAWAKLIGHPSQLTNYVCTEALKDSRINQADVDKPDKPGVRDPRAVAAAVAQLFDREPEYVREVVEAHVAVKQREALEALGIAQPAMSADQNDYGQDDDERQAADG